MYEGKYIEVKSLSAPERKEVKERCKELGYEEYGSDTFGGYWRYVEFEGFQMVGRQSEKSFPPITINDLGETMRFSVDATNNHKLREAIIEHAMSIGYTLYDTSTKTEYVEKWQYYRFSRGKIDAQCSNYNDNISLEEFFSKKEEAKQFHLEEGRVLSAKIEGDKVIFGLDSDEFSQGKEEAIKVLSGFISALWGGLNVTEVKIGCCTMTRSEVQSIINYLQGN